MLTQDLPTVQQVIDLSTSAFDDFLATGDEALFDEVEARTDAVTYDDIGAIMPPGTTGHPKGVLVRGGAMVRSFSGWVPQWTCGKVTRISSSTRTFMHSDSMAASSCACCSATNIPFPVYEPVAQMQIIERNR